MNFTLQNFDANGALKTTVATLPTTSLTGTLQAAQFPALTGDVTTSAGALATTLATVNSNVGTFAVPSITVNAKGLITAASAISQPKRATMWHDEALVTTGNALARTNNSSQNYAHYVFQSTAANGDTFTHGCWLKAGTYTMSMLGITATSAGIIDWYIDTVIIAALTGQD